MEAAHAQCAHGGMDVGPPNPASHPYISQTVTKCHSAPSSGLTLVGGPQLLSQVTQGTWNTAPGSSTYCPMSGC